jgi:hypothetical protein
MGVDPRAGSEVPERPKVILFRRDRFFQRKSTMTALQVVPLQLTIDPGEQRDEARNKDQSVARSRNKAASESKAKEIRPLRSKTGGRAFVRLTRRPRKAAQRSSRQGQLAAPSYLGRPLRQLKMCLLGVRPSAL